MTEFHAYAPGLHSGGQPSPDDLARLRDIGVGSVISLRAPAEDVGYDECAEATRVGLEWHSLPITGDDDLMPATIERFGSLLDAARAHGNDVLIHCASGNRVGALVALDAARRGESSANALALGRAAGLVGLEPAVVARLESNR